MASQARVDSAEVMAIRNSGSCRGVRCDEMIRKQSHVQVEKSLVDAILFKGELSPIRNGWGGRDQRDFAVILREQFGEDAAHVIMIVVVDEDFA